MQIGGFASNMGHGLPLEHWKLLERLTTIAQLFEKQLIFYSQDKQMMVGGERATFHAPKR